MNYIDNRINKRRLNIYGTVINGPYKTSINGQTVWASDVVLKNDKQIVYKAIIADYNFAIRYANEGSPVILQKDNSGLLQIVGKQEIISGDVTKKTYKPSIFQAKLDGLTFVSGNTYQTENGNNITIDDDSETSYLWTNRKLTFIELSPFGSKAFGASIIERT